MKDNKAEAAVHSTSIPVASERHPLYEGEQRCICNRLLCIIKGDVIEIKCPKCKRMLKIATKGIEQIECK